jgi:hypothetical protein
MNAAVVDKAGIECAPPAPPLPPAEGPGFVALRPEPQPESMRKLLLADEPAISLPTHAVSTKLAEVDLPPATSTEPFGI